MFRPVAAAKTLPVIAFDHDIAIKSLGGGLPWRRARLPVAKSIILCKYNLPLEPLE